MLVDIERIKVILQVKRNSTIQKYVRMGMPSQVCGGERLFNVDKVLSWEKPLKKSIVKRSDKFVRKIKEMITKEYANTKNIDDFYQSIMEKIEKIK